MRMLVVAVLASIAAAPVATLGNQISVTVRNEPIPAKGMIENGHFMLPLRATFETLNSSVWYDAETGSIEARNILHVLRMKVGSSTAFLDGHAVHLEAPARAINGSVYIPVAFAAEAMGAIVRYDPHANVLAVNGSPPVSVETHSVHDSIQQPQDLKPAPDSMVQTAYPVVSASLGGAMAASNAVALSVDGNDVTPIASFDGHTITYRPALGPGRHTVALTAHTASGRSASTQWSFVVTDGVGFGGFGFGNVGFGFAPGVVGNGITLIAPPTSTGFGSAQPCGIVVLQPWFNGGTAASLPCATAGTVAGNSGLFLTGSPLFPFGQTLAAPIFPPVFSPFRQFQTIIRPQPFQTTVQPQPVQPVVQPMPFPH